MRSLKSQKGFALVLFLGALPLLVGLLFLVSFSMSWIQFDLQQSHLCREISLNTQTEVARMLKDLMALNAQALQLRQAEAQARVKLLLAPDPFSKGIAWEELSVIVMRRRILAQKQNQYIHRSNLSLLRGHQAVRQKLLRNGNQYWSVWRTWLIPVFQTQFTLPPKLAVRPDIPDTAPVYQPQERFTESQALVHKWQYGIQVQPHLKFFLSGKFSFNRSCSVSLKSEGAAWIAKIQKVKSTSKSLW